MTNTQIVWTFWKFWNAILIYPVKVWANTILTHSSPELSRSGIIWGHSVSSQWTHTVSLLCVGLLWAHCELVSCELTMLTHCDLILLPHGEIFGWALCEYGVSSHLHWVNPRYYQNALFKFWNFRVPTGTAFMCLGLWPLPLQQKW